MASKAEHLYFGPPAAAQDPNLDKYFILTEAFQTISDLSDPRCIIVGKKGSGKSALVGRLAESKSILRLIIRISPDTHQIPEAKVGYSYRQYSNLFQYEIFLEILKEFLNNPKITSSFPATFVAKVEAEAFEYIRVLRNLKGKLAGINQISILGLGVSTDAPKNTVVGMASAQNSAALRGRVKEIMANNVEVIVLIDDPDLLFGEVKDLVNIIGGLLLASVNITSMSTTEKEARIKVCTFLKQHKYDMLSRKFEDFDHISQNAFTLSWKSEELDELIVKRIRFREKLAPKVSALESWARAFEVETEAALNDLKGYLYPKLRNGPRDLITFCNLAMQAARARGNAHISKDVLIDVEGSYSEECLNEVEREFGDRYPSIVLVVRKLFEHPKLKTKGDIRRKALEDALSERYRDEELQSLKKDFPWLAGTTGRNLVEVLFKVGVIGFMSKQRSGVPVMSYSSASVDDSVHNATTFFVHPAYQQALRIGDTQ